MEKIKPDIIKEGEWAISNQVVKTISDELNSFPIIVLKPLTLQATGWVVKFSEHGGKALSAYDDFLDFVRNLPKDEAMFITTISRIGANYGKGLPYVLIKWIPEDASDESRDAHSEAWPVLLNQLREVAEAAQFPLVVIEATNPRDLDSSVIRTTMKDF